ncbi:MAG TPA: toprim domain-containing protein, partial [Candidatus Paceibacterota bacterium]|nr:toprim domain-containing protein [Candidatus Paceibacterota bacterium]
VRKFTMLVEGQMDCIHSHQAGFTNAVALSGTALTEKHLSLMKRYSENLMLVLDADPAGMKATARSAALALRQGLRVKAARLPKGKDPADLVSEDAAEFTRRIAAAKPVVDFFLAELADEAADPHRLLRLSEDIVLPLIASVESPMEREHFIQNAARALGLSPESVRESLSRIPKYEPMPNGTIEDRNTAIPPARSTVEVRNEQVLAVVHAYAGTPLAERVKSRYLQVTGAHELPSLTPAEPALFEAEQAFGEAPKEEAADELLHAFEEAVIREAYQAAVSDLRKAETAGDTAAMHQAEARCAELSARLSAFGR